MKVSESDIKDYSHHRQKMVEALLVCGVKDLRVLDAMNRVPRHLFVPEVFRHKAYGDHPLQIGGNQTIARSNPPTPSRPKTLPEAKFFQGLGLSVGQHEKILAGLTYLSVSAKRKNFGGTYFVVSVV